ncbi:MAG: FTR1 family protein [Burkholderiales bacterium]|nr:FTR1 family protein [Burkholderiales bacterium]
MLNALIVVWRESLEAILVITVLLAWIHRQPDPISLRRGVWLGAIAGVGLAALLGCATYAAQSQLQGQMLEVFQACMAFVSAALVVQMVVWMRSHGAKMRHQLEARAGQAAGALGVGVVSALAVAREGAETLMFLYGLGLDAGARTLWIGAALGLVAAIACSAAITRGARYMSYRALLRMGEALLLVLAAAMLGQGMERLIGLDYLPVLLDPVWDSSSWLDDSTGLGHILSSFAGYRSRPSGTLLLAYFAFWSGVAFLLRPSPSRRISHHPHRA